MRAVTAVGFIILVTFRARARATALRQQKPITLFHEYVGAD